MGNRADGPNNAVSMSTWEPDDKSSAVRRTRRGSTCPWWPAPTYDAVRSTATVLPEFDTLHVVYVSASEEYPEYVGSVYNDVMEVRVNGERCSAVPGTGLPEEIVVSIAIADTSDRVWDSAVALVGGGTYPD